jgi:hypothetical protein
MTYKDDFLVTGRPRLEGADIQDVVGLVPAGQRKEVVQEIEENTGADGSRSADAWITEEYDICTSEFG